MSKKLIIASEVKNWDKIYEFIHKYFTKKSLPQKRIFEMLVSSEEIFSNIIRHSHSEISEKITISVDCEPLEKTASVVFKYGGVQFSPLDADSPDVSLPSRERELGGLGLLIVKNLVDDVLYTYSDGKNILKISKKITDF